MEYLDYLCELYAGTSRQGPGSEASTIKALSLLSLPKNASILDIGCGSGGQTLTLLKNTTARITAVDIFDRFLDDLSRGAEKLGLSGRLKTIKADMKAMPFGPGEFDCVWSEGAACIIGFSKALKEWRKLLKPGGFLAVSELTLISDNPPAEVLSYWKRAYTEADLAANNLVLASRCGYTTVGHFVLPKEDWLEYYDGVRKNLEVFRRKYAADPGAAPLIKETEDEIVFYHKYSAHYSYVFYILRRY